MKRRLIEITIISVIFGALAVAADIAPTLIDKPDTDVIETCVVFFGVIGCWLITMPVTLLVVLFGGRQMNGCTIIISMIIVCLAWGLILSWLFAFMRRSSGNAQAERADRNGEK